MHRVRYWGRERVAWNFQDTQGSCLPSSQSSLNSLWKGFYGGFITGTPLIKSLAFVSLRTGVGEVEYWETLPSKTLETKLHRS